MAWEISAPVGKRYGAQVTNTVSDQVIITMMLNMIPAAQGGMREPWLTSPPPSPKSPGVCAPALAKAIMDFQMFWKKRGEFHVIDGCVDPGKHTLAKLNELMALNPPPAPPPPPPPAPVDPLAMAESAKMLAGGLTLSAINALSEYRNGFNVERNMKIRAALNRHFQFGKVASEDEKTMKVAFMVQEYRNVLNVFANSASIFQSATDDQARADCKRTDVVPAYAVFRQYVRFTSRFHPYNRADGSGQGDYTAAMILIHESIHYCDKGAPDFAYEWQDTYDSLTPDQALHNPSSYAAFAAEIWRGTDTPRPGAGNPQL